MSFPRRNISRNLSRHEEIAVALAYTSPPRKCKPRKLRGPPTCALIPAHPRQAYITTRTFGLRSRRRRRRRGGEGRRKKYLLLSLPSSASRSFKLCEESSSRGTPREKASSSMRPSGAGASSSFLRNSLVGREEEGGGRERERERERERGAGWT